MGVETIRVPDIGTDGAVDVIEVSVGPGDQVTPEDTIVVLESDKASVEVPAPSAGKVARLLVKVGDRVRQDDPLLELEQESAGEQAAAPSSPAKDSPAGKEAATDEAGEASRPAPDTKKPQRGAAAPDRKAGGEETVEVPDLGDIAEAELIELHLKPGDRIEAEQVVAVLESDKASMEIPSPRAGEVLEVLVKTGDRLRTGQPLFRVRTDEAGAASPSEERTTAKKASSPTPPPSRESEGKPASPTPRATTGTGQAPPAGATAHAGPAVRKLAREMGVDLTRVPGSGPRNRITKDDVHAWVRKQLAERPAGGGAMPELPDIDFSRFGEVERVELSRIRQAAAKNLHRSWLVIPHVTQHDEADITDLEEFRQSENKRLQKQGVKLTMLAFMAKACAAALREFPDFNSSLDKSGEALVRKKYIHIGVAVDTDNGLVVPVLRDVDKKGIVDIAREVGSLAEKARARKLSPGDMQGASFSISSLGGLGGTAFTPIVNWPEVAILGVSKSQWKPFWNGKEFVPRLMVPLSLSYDHRVIDGAAAARFVTFLGSTLTDMRRALL